ncbi:acetate--CoA ligase family protein [Haladaptatus sp. GCM10025893]|uniref:acetate--CoA ligase family protein n=1 Tax=Haladaptatus sp. GCM10025893 TaxID=3252659 RepID=UPI0036173C23
MPTVETRLVTDADGAAAAVESITGPAVLKIDSPKLPHRTDVGAVRLGVDSPTETREAYDEVLSAAQAHVGNDDIEGVLVQPMVDDGVETMVGVAPGDVFDSLVTVGPGGTFVEALDESATLVPPFTRADALRAVEDTVQRTCSPTAGMVIHCPSNPSSTSL